MSVIVDALYIYMDGLIADDCNKCDDHWNMICWLQEQIPTWTIGKSLDPDHASNRR